MKINLIILLMCISILLAIAVFLLLIHDMYKYKKQKANIKKLSRKEFESRITARQLIERKEAETYKDFIRRSVKPIHRFGVKP